MSSRSGSEGKKPRRQQQVYESEGEESEDYQPQPQRKRNQGKRRGGQGPLDNLALDNVQNTAGGLVNSATGALGGVAGNAVQQQGQKDGGKSDTLRLRLDLNLDVEITLKAKIHGDLELALLYVIFFPLDNLAPCFCNLNRPYPSSFLLPNTACLASVSYAVISAFTQCLQYRRIFQPLEQEALLHKLPHPRRVSYHPVASLA